MSTARFFVFVFFFNDTATTEIYTLSLHDALPISDIEFVVGFDVDKRKVNKPLNEAIYSDPNCCMKLVDSVPDNGAKVYMGHILDGVAEQDRKSTRLNSSHALISYAVFCLKKKNKKI